MAHETHDESDVEPRIAVRRQWRGLRKLVRFAAICFGAIALVAFAAIPWKWKAEPRIGSWRAIAYSSKGRVFAYCANPSRAMRLWTGVGAVDDSGVILAMQVEERIAQRAREHAELLAQRRKATCVVLTDREASYHAAYEADIESQRVVAEANTQSAIGAMRVSASRAPFFGVRVIRLGGAALVMTPLWVVGVAGIASGLMCLALDWMLARLQRPGQGHCRRCGYDLTKNESGRCPECGVAVAGAAMPESMNRESNGSSAAPPGRSV